MFNRGKSNQERKETGTELSVVSGIRLGMDSRLSRKERKRERKRERKIGARSSLSYSLHRISVERHPRSLS